MSTGITITVNEDGSYTLSEFDGSFNDLQDAVGGSVEAAPSNPLVTIWVNEDGKGMNLPVNRLAMDIWLRWDDFGCMLIGRDYLVGNVVITGGVDDVGETVDLPVEARRWINNVAREANVT